MGYYIDLKKISIDKYKKMLREADLIPSWKVLKDNVDGNFDILKQHDIRNLDELLISIKTKKKIHEFSMITGISDNYLTILRRAINGYLPKPNKIKDFPHLSEEVVERLEKMGVKNTLHLYDEILTPPKRKKLSHRIGVSEDEIIKLAKLTDLSRIKWVNHTFANVLLQAGYETVKNVAEADYKKMYEKIRRINKEQDLYRGNVGEHDMKLCVEAAQVLDFEIVI